MADIQKIKQLARKASKGPWHPGHLGQEDMTCECRTIADGFYGGGIATVHVDNGIASISEGGNDCPPYEEAVANMNFIAAANPHSVLEMIVELEQATAERDALRTYAHEATKAITGLSGGGSENFSKEIAGIFTADLERCKDRVRSRLATAGEMAARRSDVTTQQEV